MGIKEEKRNEILKAALKVFSEAGFEGAKIEDIAKEAGIGKGTVYEYFDSKNTLFLEMIRYSVEKYKEGLSYVLSEGDNMLTKISNLSFYNAKFTSEHIDIVNSSMSGLTLSEDMRTQMFKDWAVCYKVIDDTVRAGIQSLELRANLDPEMATSLIVGGLKQYIMKKVFIDRLNPEEIDHKGIAKTILNGLV